MFFLSFISIQACPAASHPCVWSSLGVACYVCVVNRTTFRNCIFNAKYYWIEQTYGQRWEKKELKIYERKSEKFFHLLFLIIILRRRFVCVCVFVGASSFASLYNLSRFMKWKRTTRKKKINKKISTQALFSGYRMKSSMRYFESSKEKCKWGTRQPRMKWMDGK